MPAVKLIRRADWHSMSWKNGGGITHELARLDDELGWVWRVSVAEVASDGPFSLFPDIDRLIVLLRGAGFELQFADTQARLLEAGAHLHFAGDLACECRLIAGPVEDFNLMLRRGAGRAWVQRLDVAAAQVISAEAEQQAVLVMSGELLVTAENQSWSLGVDDCLWLSGLKCDTPSATLQATAGTASVLLVHLSLTAASIAR